MFGRLIMLMFAALVIAAVIQSLPDIKRYLAMRRM
jgi:hypothetical protein